MGMKHIFIVEDDLLLNKTLAYNLKADGYQITAAACVGEAVPKLQNQNFDLALFDVGLPDGNGLALCQMMKQLHPDTPVIFLTANDQEKDQLRGYEAGAVDYITKPFSILALQRKISALFSMLEASKPDRDFFDDGHLMLDFSGLTAALDNTALTLSPMEYKVLHLFCQNKKQVLTRQQLLERLWDQNEHFVDEHTLTTTISRLRSKIESKGSTYIKTVYGMGYLWTGGEAE